MKSREFYIKDFLKEKLTFDALSVGYDEANERVNIKMHRVFGDETVVFYTLSIPIKAAQFLAYEIDKLEEQEETKESK